MVFLLVIPFSIMRILNYRERRGNSTMRMLVSIIFPDGLAVIGVTDDKLVSI